LRDRENRNAPLVTVVRSIAAAQSGITGGVTANARDVPGPTSYGRGPKGTLQRTMFA
jgi:hypothetical protein